MMYLEDHPEMDRQLKLEDEMVSLGIDRYRNIVKGHREDNSESNTTVGKTIIGQLFEDVLEGLHEFYHEIETTGTGRKAVAYDVLKKKIDDDELCVFLALRTLIDGMTGRPTLTQAVVQVANAIEDEMHYKAFKNQAYYSYDRALDRAKKSPSPGYKRRTMRESARKKGIKFTGFSQHEATHLGGKLVDIVIEKTGLFVVQPATRSQPPVITPAEGFLERVEEFHKAREWMSPIYMPTVIPPRPWTGPFEGGYWSKGGRFRRLLMVKTWDREYLQRLEDHPMPTVYTALNAVQNTAWRINRSVFNVMATMWELGIDVEVLPKADPVPLPAKPVWLEEYLKYEDMTEEQQEEFTDWKKRTKETYEFNAQQTSKRLHWLRTFKTAERFHDEPEIYFPHQLDFRGRMYPVPLFLSPQGSEETKALLEFAKGKALGSREAVRWLASHGAGCWGVDKVSFDERLRWVERHQNEILACAEDPLSNLFWTTAEKPWSALAFAFEWQGYVEKGLAHVSHLPVQMDGSCNGLQHFSAMLRDPVGGAAVNLLPSETPNDIYQAVADAVNDLMREDVADEDEEKAKIASQWLGHVTRKVTKRPTMTLAYGAKQYGFTDQVFTDTIKPWLMESPDTFPFEGNGYRAAMYMASKIWEATGVTVVGARGAMKALQQWTSALAKAGHAVEWETPAGFPMRQYYKVLNTRVIELAFGKQRFQMRVQKPDEEQKKAKVDKRKQASGIAPNFVHSLDATHLMFTVESAIHEDIQCFSMVHDSYGTHAADAPKLARILREEFIGLYVDHDVLEGFRSTIASVLGTDEDLDPVPAKGDLDLQDVAHAEYFFA